MKINSVAFSLFNHRFLRSLSVSLLLILNVIASRAQDRDNPWHLVVFENGKEVAYYNAEVITGIKVTPQNVTVILDNGIEFSHPITTTTFGFEPRKAGEGTVNDYITAPKWSVLYTDGRLYFSEMVKGVTVYTLSGALVAVSVGDCTELQVSLRQGIYVIQAGDQHVKLLVGMNGYGGATLVETRETHWMQNRASEDGNIKTFWNLTTGNMTVPVEMSKVDRFHFITDQSVVFTLKNGNTVELEDYKGTKFEIEPVWATTSNWNIYLSMLFGGLAYGVDESLPVAERYNTKYVTAFTNNEIICYDINNKIERRYPIGFFPAHEARIAMFRESGGVLMPAYSYKTLADSVDFLSIDDGQSIGSVHASNWPNGSNLGETTISIIDNENLKAVFEAGEYVFKFKPDVPNDGVPWVGVNFTQADVTALKLRKVYFGHKSVGGNIVAGIRRLSTIDLRTAYNQPEQNDQSLRTTITQLSSGPAFVEHDIGSDGLPFDKIASFERFMNDIIRDNVEIAFFKFCYMDFDARTDVQALITTYKMAMDRLHARFPNVIFAHLTVPLYSRPASFDNSVREQFSDWLRDTYKDKVFDLAVIESIDPAGKAALSHDNITIAMADEWTDDGGHLSQAGQDRLAGALIAFLAQLKR